MSGNNINIFNERIYEFVNFLDTLTNDAYVKRKLQKYSSRLKLAECVDKSYALNLFEENLYKYKDRIFNKDTTILHQFQEILFENKIKISEMWKYLSVEDKETIWKYLKIFILLCD